MKRAVNMLVTGVVLVLGLAVLPVTAVASTADHAFTDVPYGHQFADAIQILVDRDVVDGYSDGTFRPENPVLRAQLAKMILLMIASDEWTRLDELVRGDMALPPFTDFGMPDSPESLYPHDFVSAAWQHGIIRGTTSHTFSPWAPATRAQAITMTVRATEAQHPWLIQWDSQLYEPWGDFDPAHGTPSAIAYQSGFLDGIVYTGAPGIPVGTYVSPWAPMTRGEAAQLLSNVIQLRDGYWESESAGG